MTKGRFIGVVVMALAAIFLVSFTLGRAIYEGRTPGMTSFALIHFAGYLFFLLMPVEALVPVYQAEGHAVIPLVVVAVVTAVAAQLIDYGIGRAVSDRVIHGFIGEKRFARFEDKIRRWGGGAIFLFNLFPLSSPNMLLVAGVTRFSMPWAFFYSTLGLTAKYLTIAYLFRAAVG